MKENVWLTNSQVMDTNVYYYEEVYYHLFHHLYILDRFKKVRWPLRTLNWTMSAIGAEAQVAMHEDKTSLANHTKGLYSLSDNVFIRVFVDGLRKSPFTMHLSNFAHI